MKDIFGKAVYELCHYLHLLLLSAKEGDKIRVLDWTDSLVNDAAYDFFVNDGSDSECTKESLCQLPVNIDSFCNEPAYDDTECLKFNNISLRDVKDNSYDLVVLRHMTERDNGIDDVIKRAAKALKDGGVLYANLIITKELDEIFKATEKHGLCLVAATKIIMERGLLEYGNETEVEAFKSLYDIQGYIQLAFRKGKYDKFVYTEASDANSFKEDDPSAIEFLAMAFFNIEYALEGRSHILSSEDDKWIRSSKEVDITETKNYIPRMKEDSFFGLSDEPLIPNSVKIRFSDYFEVDTPQHKKFSQLETDKYYYLSPSLAVHSMIDNIINADQSCIPDDVLRHINLNNLGNVYTLIDNDGNVLKETRQWLAIRDNALRTVGKESCCENKPIELHALNNIYDAGIDIEGTLLYNLIRIKPKGDQIDLEYLKMYFYIDELTRLFTVGLSNGVNYPLSVYEKLREKSDSQAGYYAIHHFCDNHCFQNPWKESLNPDENGIYHNTEFGTYTVDDVLNSYIYVDDLNNHEELKENFKLRHDNSLDRYRVNVQRRFADIAFLNNLRKREDGVRASYDAETVVSLINAEKQLAMGELTYDVYSNLNEDISLRDYFMAVEIYLRLCLACCKNKKKIYCGDRYIGNIGKFTMGDLCYIYRNSGNKQHLFKQGIDKDKYSLLLQRLSEYRNARNETAHRNSGVTADEAKDKINEIYETLMMIDEMVTD